MNVLINMEMPESCINCPFSNSINFGAVCCPTHTIIPDSKLFDDVGEPLDRQPWCPLIEVPPHGRLIDVNELKEWVENWFEINRFYHPYSKSNDIPVPDLYDILERMPTVIPAVKDGET